MQEENHKKIMLQCDSKTETEAVFAMKAPRTGHISERPTYKNCGKIGHEESSCFDLIGYPPRWIARGGGRGCGRGRGGRGGRGTTGHGRGSTVAYATHANADEN